MRYICPEKSDIHFVAPSGSYYCFMFMSITVTSSRNVCAVSNIICKNIATILICHVS